MAKGYWIVNVTVEDAEAYQRYRENVVAPLAAFGGHFLVRAGAQMIAEGTARPRSVVIEFPSYAAARDCYNSLAYKTAAALRAGAAEMDLVIVEGYAAQTDTP